MTQTFLPIGLAWKIKLQGNGKNFFLSLAKQIVLGNLLNKGDDIYYYLGDINGRKALITLLDSKPLKNSEKIMIKEGLLLETKKEAIL